MHPNLNEVNMGEALNELVFFISKLFVVKLKHSLLEQAWSCCTTKG